MFEFAKDAFFALVGTLCAGMTVISVAVIVAVLIGVSAAARKKGKNNGKSDD